LKQLKALNHEELNELKNDFVAECV